MIETRNSERNVRTNNYPSTRTRSAGSALPAGFFSATGRPQAADRRAASATNVARTASPRRTFGAAPPRQAEAHVQIS